MVFKAAQDGKVTVINAFLKDGYDPNIKHELGWSPLHVAAVNSQREVVDVLLKFGADPNLPDDYSSIYHKAREKGMHTLDVLTIREEDFSSNLNQVPNFSNDVSNFLQAVYILQQANFRGCTPLHYAVLADDSAVVSLLLEAGADPLRANDYGKTPVRTPSDTCG